MPLGKPLVVNTEPTRIYRLKKNATFIEYGQPWKPDQGRKLEDCRDGTSVVRRGVIVPCTLAVKLYDADDTYCQFPYYQHRCYRHRRTTATLVL